jgi:hypothetical protein
MSAKGWQNTFANNEWMICYDTFQVPHFVVDDMGNTHSLSQQQTYSPLVDISWPSYQTIGNPHHIVSEHQDYH